MKRLEKQHTHETFDPDQGPTELQTSMPNKAVVVYKSLRLIWFKTYEPRFPIITIKRLPYDLL